MTDESRSFNPIDNKINLATHRVMLETWSKQATNEEIEPVLQAFERTTAELENDLLLLPEDMRQLPRYRKLQQFVSRGIRGSIKEIRQRRNLTAKKSGETAH